MTGLDDWSEADFAALEREFAPAPAVNERYVWVDGRGYEQLCAVCTPLFSATSPSACSWCPLRRKGLAHRIASAGAAKSAPKPTLLARVRRAVRLSVPGWSVFTRSHNNPKGSQ